MMIEKANVMKIFILGGIVIAIALFTLSYSLTNVPSKSGSNSTIYPDLTSVEIPNDIAGELSHNIVLQKNLPKNTEHIMTYKVVPPQYTREDILTMGRKFNISEPYQIKGSDEGFSIREVDKDIHVLIMNTGWMEYWNSPRHSVNSLDVPGNLPSDEEAEKIATSFLKERNLLPDDAEVRRIDHVKTYNLGNDGQKFVTWEDIEVWYGRKLNGYPVNGTQLMLGIGAHGDPIEFITNWRNYEPYKELPVKSPNTAFDELKTRGVPVGINKEGIVSIDNTYLAYHTKPGSQMEYYLEPVWVFKGNVTVDGRAVDSVEAYIPALTDDAVKSLASI
jgi:hypothetical protein